jgi:8-oxo-dGTP pyrophosphatase MutT (NUDIX family)
MPDPVTLDSWLKTQTWPDVRELICQGPAVPYGHPYGFTVCRLETEWFPGWQIRVHLWPSRDEILRSQRENGVVDQLVHCHGWDLKSSVCLGLLSEFQYEVAVWDGKQDIYRVVSDYADGSSSLILEQKQMQSRLVAEHQRGARSGVEFIPAGDYHSTITAGPPAVSVVATSRTHKCDSRVIGPPATSRTIANARHLVEDLDGLLRGYDQIYLEAVGDADRWASFVFMVDESNRVLLARSIRRPELWQPIGGRAESFDQDPVATVIRETEEEVGIRLEPSQLVELEVVDRDVGNGRLYFWITHVKSDVAIRVARPEILCLEWKSISNLNEPSTYPGTRSALQYLSRYLRDEGRMGE